MQARATDEVEANGQEASQPASEQKAPYPETGKLKVFISYSRKDLEYADWLLAELNARGFEAYLDRNDIAPGEPWRERLGALILSADTIVFVLSPDFIISEICAWEVAECERLSKRPLPVVWRPLDEKAAPPRLARLNWIFCNTADAAPAALAAIESALKTDINWIREHTRRGEQAERWQERARPSALLIRGNDLEEAESWVGKRPPEAPPPTEGTQAFIAASRRAAARRRSLLSGSLAAGLLVASGLAALAYWQRGLAIEERDRALITQSRFLADAARQWLADGDAVSAALLAIEALPDKRAKRIRPYVPDAELALSDALALRLERLVLQGHEGLVETAVFSPDDRRIVTASHDKTARIWDSQTGRTTAVLRHEDVVRSAAFSPDGQRVLTVAGAKFDPKDNSARIWDTESGDELAILKGHDNVIVTATFSPDAKRVITASWDWTARIWESETGRELGVLDHSPNRVLDASFSPDGKRVLTLSADGSARLWDAPSLAPLAALSDPGRGGIGMARFSKDGRRFLTTMGTPRLWDGETGKEIAVLKAGTGPINSVAFSPDGTRLLTGSSDKIARLWEAGTGTHLADLTGHTGSVVSVAFDDAGRSIVTGSKDASVRLWNGTTGTALGVLQGHAAPLSSASFGHRSQTIVTASHDSTARLWLSDIDKPFVALHGHTEPVWSVAFSPDGQRLVTTSRDKTARVWNCPTGELIAVLRGHKFGAHASVFGSDGKLIATTSGLEKSARIWDSETGSEVAAFAVDAGDSGSFSPDLKLFASKTAAGVRLVETLSGKELAVLGAHAGRPTAMTFSRDGLYFAAASEDGTARLWDLTRNIELAALKGTGAYINSLDLSFDGRLLLAASNDAAARVWDVAAGKELVVLSGHSSPVGKATFSSDAKYILTVAFGGPQGTVPSDNTVRLWDAQSGRQLWLAKGDRGVKSAFFLGRGERIATLDYDANLVRIWDRTSGKQIAGLKDHKSRMNAVAVSPDGQWLATGSDDGSVRLWRIFPTTQDLLDAAKSNMPRCLTVEQRQQWFLDPEPPAWCMRGDKEASELDAGKREPKWPFHTPQ